MQCTSCGILIQDDSMFCPKCGKKLLEIIKEDIQKEIESELKQCQISTPIHENSIKDNMQPKEVDSTSSERGDPKKVEYKDILRRLFSDRNVASEDVISLSSKIRLLGIDKTDALKLQREVAKELGVDIQEEEICRDLILELNENRTYFKGEMNNLEFSLRNSSKDTLEGVSISSYLMNLKRNEKEHIGLLRPLKQKVVYLPFQHDYCGKEIVRISLIYCDTKGNPSIYEAEFEVEVFNKEDKKEGHKSISISITADRIMGNDFSNMAEIYQKKEEQNFRKSFLQEESGKNWIPLFPFLNEGETDKRRKEILIKRRLVEGENYLSEGEKLKKEGEGLFHRDKKSARESLSDAFNSFKEAEDCFKKILEIDHENANSLEKTKRIKKFCSEITEKIGKLEREPTVPFTRLASGCLTLDHPQKRVFIYSKERITLGRDTGNDLGLRLLPYRWKEEYEEEVRKMMRENVKFEKIPVEYFPSEKHKKNLINSTMISSKHAEIIEKAGRFYIRDIGSTNGTFVEGKKLKANEEHLLKDESRINVAGVLDLELRFFGEFKKAREKGSSFDSCFTVLGEKSDSCFGIDKKGVINAIKITRLNNYSEGEEYIILVREVTIGSSRTNAVVIEGEKVSDIHAKVFYRDGQYWIEDLNSRSGTKVNDDEINPLVEVPLVTQAEITIGDINLRFEGGV